MYTLSYCTCLIDIVNLMHISLFVYQYEAVIVSMRADLEESRAEYAAAVAELTEEQTKASKEERSVTEQSESGLE